MSVTSRIGRGRDIAAGVAAVALAATLAGCGGGSNNSPHSSPTASSSTSSTAAKAQITQNWQKFFNKTTPLNQKAALLQNGSSMTQVLQLFSEDPRVGQATARVTGVTVNSASTATVTYQVLLGGHVALPSAQGQAVLQNGQWKVGDTALCALVQLSGSSSTVPGCS